MGHSLDFSSDPVTFLSSSGVGSFFGPAMCCNQGKLCFGLSCEVYVVDKCPIDYRNEIFDEESEANGGFICRTGRSHL